MTAQSTQQQEDRQAQGTQSDNPYHGGPFKGPREGYTTPGGNPP